MTMRSEGDIWQALCPNRDRLYAHGAHDEHPIAAPGVPAPPHAVERRGLCPV